MQPVRILLGHRYAALRDLKNRQAQLIALCDHHRLKGAILLSPEGIHLRVAGEVDGLEHLLATLRSWHELKELAAAMTVRERSPFRGMTVRVKNELIRLGVPDIDPTRHAAVTIDAAELNRWLDESRAFTLLDVRNRHEVAAGAFVQARALPIAHFHELPAALASIDPAINDDPVVVICSDGLRSRKAAVLLEHTGFRTVLFLEGGIARYLEGHTTAHFIGECLDADLRLGAPAAGTRTLCAQCGKLLRSVESEHANATCCCDAIPMEQRLAARHSALREYATVLPGREPRDQFRPITIPADCDGSTLVEALCRVVVHAPERFWRDRCRQGLLLDAQGEPCTPEQVVRAGEHFRHRFPAVVEPDVNMAITVLHEEDSFLVVDKPAPLPMHAGGRFHRNTLMFVLDAVYAPEQLRPSHRLDANTSGAMVIARTRAAARSIQMQFARGTVGKTYLVRVFGHPPHDEFSCDAPISATAGEMGSRAVDVHNGQAAHTNFKVIRRDIDGTSLLEAQPLTGRTNQIRVHLWHLGWPVRGDSVYLPDHELGDRQTLDIDSPPMCLHAWHIAFTHPMRRETVSFTAAAPGWAHIDGSPPSNQG